MLTGMYIVLEYFTPLALVVLFMTTLFAVCVMLVLLEHDVCVAAQTLVKRGARAVRTDLSSRDVARELVEIALCPISPLSSAVQSNPETVALNHAAGYAPFVIAPPPGKLAQLPVRAQLYP
ncbi:MAG: hypothetical protein ACRD18_08445 [Terriglobia bacterium]